MTLGFVGLGAMGLPMMTRIAAAGHEVRAFDCEPARLERASLIGGMRTAPDIRSLARECEVVVSCLPSAEAVESVFHSSDGVVASLAPGSLVIECSTVGRKTALTLARALAARGADYVEAPLFGTEERAQSGELFLLLGGEARAIERALTFVRLVANDWMHFGPAGSANAVKVAQNGLGLVQAAAIAIAIASIERAGVEPRRFIEAVIRAKGMAASPLFGWAAPRMIDEKLPEYPAYSHIMLKDMRLALEMACEWGVEEGLLEATLDLIARIQSQRYSADGFQALGRLARGARHSTDLTGSDTGTTTRRQT